MAVTLTMPKSDTNADAALLALRQEQVAALVAPEDEEMLLLLTAA